MNNFQYYLNIKDVILYQIPRALISSSYSPNWIAKFEVIICYLRNMFKFGDGLGVWNEGQTRAASNDFTDIHVLLISQVSEDRENSEASQKTGERVHCGHDYGIPKIEDDLSLIKSGFLPSA